MTMINLNASQIKTFYRKEGRQRAKALADAYASATGRFPSYRAKNGKWKYLYHAVDKGGETIDFLLAVMLWQETSVLFNERLDSLLRQNHEDCVTSPVSSNRLIILIIIKYDSGFFIISTAAL
jgi:hypothetical protein